MASLQNCSTGPGTYPPGIEVGGRGQESQEAILAASLQNRNAGPAAGTLLPSRSKERQWYSPGDGGFDVYPASDPFSVSVALCLILLGCFLMPMPFLEREFGVGGHQMVSDILVIRQHLQTTEVRLIPAGGAYS